MKVTSADNLAHFTLTLAFLATSLSLYQPVLSWILILVVCSATMRFALFFKLHKHSPSLRTLNLLAVLSGIVLAYFSLQLGVLLGMVNLLVMACSLKLMLLRNHKDYFQLITSTGFLIGCGFIFQQGIGASLFYLLMLGLLLLSLAMHFSPSRAVLANSKHIGVMALQASPIALLLFLVLPQIGPLWQMPSAKSTTTGLTEKVTPGDIAQLSQSSDLAFRATFNGTVPAFTQRYWRALVLEEFDGQTWQVAKQRKQIRQQYFVMGQEFSPSVSGPYYEYDIIAQPTQQRWLYGLDLAVTQGSDSSSKIWQSQDYQLIAVNPLVSQFQYRLRSYPTVPLNQSLYSLDKRLNLDVPNSGNPATVEWARELRSRYSDDRELINAIMQHFSQQPFTYTLSPPLMQQDPVDQFLFEQQQGFCSHYASAMAYVLRLAGIPARLVTGYQGGELHQAGYLSVYQYDAHAWVEAWFDDRGWQRFDPTAMVAPDRINLGLRGAISEEEFLSGQLFSLAKLRNIPWLNELRLLLADIDYNWSKWVLGFNRDKQLDLFKSILGKLTPQKLAYFGLATLLIICLLLALFYLPLWRYAKPPRHIRLYHSALQCLAKHGINRDPSTGPIAFAQFVQHKVPEEASVLFRQITEIYVAFHYDEPNGRAPEAQQSLKNMAILLSQLSQVLNRKGLLKREILQR